MLLTRDRSIPVAFVVFDVLKAETIMHRPYWQRRGVIGPPSRVTRPYSALRVLMGD